VRRGRRGIWAGRGSPLVGREFGRVAVYENIATAVRQLPTTLGGGRAYRPLEDIQRLHVFIRQPLNKRSPGIEVFRDKDPELTEQINESQDLW
jgi:hypothetical protein